MAAYTEVETNRSKGEEAREMVKVGLFSRENVFVNPFQEPSSSAVLEAEVEGGGLVSFLRLRKDLVRLLALLCPSFTPGCSEDS